MEEGPAAPARVRGRRTRSRGKTATLQAGGSGLRPPAAAVNGTKLSYAHRSQRRVPSAGSPAFASRRSRARGPCSCVCRTVGTVKPALEVTGTRTAIRHE